MKNLFITLVTLGATGFAGYNFYLFSLGPCERLLEYAIGQFDPNFGVSQANFKAQLILAEKVWETALGRDIFVYEPEADFKINLIYDTRQQNTDAKQKAEFGLTAVEESFNKINKEFNVLKNNYESRSAAYERAKKDFEQAQTEYQQKVNFWNKRGGAPENEFEKLEQQRLALNQSATELNAEAKVLNQMAEEVNRFLESRNKAASEYNQVVRDYNKKFGHGLEFNQAEYVGEAINVYQFTNNTDLALALTHEFGHALGMEHIENPNSIMHYLTEEGGIGNIVPTAEDLAELKRVCKIK